MKKQTIFSILILLLLAGPTSAAVLQDQYRHELKDLKGLTAIHVDNVNGDCRIVATDGNVIRVEGIIQIKGGSDEECRDFYGKAEITTTVGGSDVWVNVSYPKNRGFFSFGRSVSMQVDFEIHVPAGLDADVELVNGDVVLEHVGDCRVELINGDVSASEIKSMAVDLINGSVEIRGVRTSVSCDVVNGGMKLYTDSPQLEKVVAETVNGTIQVHLPASVIGRIHMSSATGTTYLKEETTAGEWKVKLKSKTITMAEHGPARINLENVNGKIVLYCRR